MKYYLLIVYGDIEPALKGPYKTRQARDCAAYRHRQTTDKDGVFILNVTPGGTPQVGTYSGGYMTGQWGDPCKKQAGKAKKR